MGANSADQTRAKLLEQQMKEKHGKDWEHKAGARADVKSEKRGTNKDDKWPPHGFLGPGMLR